MRAIGAGKTDVGLQRDHNEDAFHVDVDGGVYVVCDGMGGHEGGEVASAAAVQAVVEHMKTGGADLPALVEAAALYACSRVHAISKTPEGKEGMGCTLTMLVVRNGTAVMGHVGDSRLYRRRGATIEQLSEDHTWVHQAVKSGKMTAEEAENHPKAHALINAVGLHEDCDVDVESWPVQVGDRFLLCSDGLSNYVTGASPLDFFLDSDDDAATAADKLIAWVLQGDAADNTTAVIVDIVGDTAPVELLEAGPVAWPTVDLAAVRGLSPQTLSFAAGDVLVASGAPCDRWIVVAEGAAEVVRFGRSARAVEAGHSVGADCLLAPRTAKAEVRATSAGSALVFDRATLDGLSADKRVAVLELIGRHLSDTARTVGYAGP